MSVYIKKEWQAAVQAVLLIFFFAKVELQETNLPEPASNYCTKIRELNKADRATFDKVKNKPTRPKDVNHTYLVKINII